MKIGILASAIACLAVPTAAFAQQSSDPLQQWVETCNALEMVTKRVGQVSTSDIRAGVETLQGSGLVERITKQTNEEACLTLVASGEIGASAFIVNKPDPSTLPSAENPAMPFAPMEAALTEKLERLDLGYYVPAPGESADPKYRKLYESHPKEAKKAAWHSLMIQSRTSQRSISAFFKGYCVVISETSPLAEYARVGFRGDLDGALSDADHQWLRENGDAHEFWHEAAHCQLNPIGQMTQPQRTERVMTNARDFSEQCNSGFAEDVFNMTLGRASVRQSDLQAYAKDLRILYGLATESYADDLAKGIMNERWDRPSAGCVPAEDRVDHPWDKFRLADSVRNPSIVHMTWLAPFLTEQPLPNQAQALSDSWAALKEISFDEVTIPGKESLVRKVLAGRADGEHLTPSPAPDEQRKLQWKSWIQGKLGL
jgi:hypothetical protein